MKKTTILFFVGIPVMVLVGCMQSEKQGKEILKMMLTGEIGEIYVWNIIEMYEESTRN